MTLTKADLARKIAKESSISPQNGSAILESFLQLLKVKVKLNNVKISGFGTFSVKKTLKRVGRNPKTSKSYIIFERKKLNFKPSNITKEKLN